MSDCILDIGFNTIAYIPSRCYALHTVVAYLVPLTILLNSQLRVHIRYVILVLIHISFKDQHITLSVIVQVTQSPGQGRRPWDTSGSWDCVSPVGSCIVGSREDQDAYWNGPLMSAFEH